MPKPEYLGDGVYASQDLSSGFPLVLTTGDHRPTLADSKIAFEPDVLNRLQEYLLAIKQEQAES